jgi:Transposase DDE domain/Transposase domain (DUF772)
MSLKNTISPYWNIVQSSLFPFLEDNLEAPLSKRLMNLIAILDMVRIEEFVSVNRNCVGRPPKSRFAVARAFIAKAVFDIPTTLLLIDRLKSDKNLRRVCGFETSFQIPCESTFSRAFNEFAITELPNKVHEALIKDMYQDTLLEHVSYDTTAIVAREKKTVKEKKIKIKKTKRAKKGCRELTRIEKQASGKMSLQEMLNDLPKHCDIGRKTSSTGYYNAWKGYKLNLAVDDNSITLAALLTSASLNDSQSAIPLSILTNSRLNNLYDLMDSAYYADAIISHSKSIGHVPIISVAAKNTASKQKQIQEKKAQKSINWQPPEKKRHKKRICIERTNARVKDEFGANHLRVKGHAKVFAHLMFGILALTANQLLKLIT